jgi:hypothetical protein
LNYGTGKLLNSKNKKAASKVMTAFLTILSLQKAK